MMSKVKTRKEIAEELEAVKAEMQILTEASAGELIAVNAALVEAQTQVEQLKVELSEASAGLENAIAEREEANNKASVSVEWLEAATAERDMALAALENPAHLDAVKIVPTDIDQATEDAEADEQESDEEVAEPEATTLLEKYLRMDQGSERVSFWEANKRELLKQFEEENN